MENELKKRTVPKNVQKLRNKIKTMFYGAKTTITKSLTPKWIGNGIGVLKHKDSEISLQEIIGGSNNSIQQPSDTEG